MLLMVSSHFSFMQILTILEYTNFSAMGKKQCTYTYTILNWNIYNICHFKGSISTNLIHSSIIIVILRWLWLKHTKTGPDLSLIYTTLLKRYHTYTVDEKDHMKCGWSVWKNCSFSSSYFHYEYIFVSFETGKTEVWRNVWKNKQSS